MKTLTLCAMSEKGFRVLQHLQKHFPGLIRAVVSASDSGVDNDFFDEIQALCDKDRIPFFPRNKGIAPPSDYTLAVSWRWLIDPNRGRVVVLHDSLLPTYRGFNPLVTALIAAEPVIGVTMLFAADSYDTGDIIAQSAFAITYPLTIAEAIQRILPHYVSLAFQLAQTLVDGLDPTSHPQSEADATYSLWRDEDDYFIDWNQSADSISRFVDAVGSPYKGAATVVDGQFMRVVRTTPVPDVKITNRTSGKVVFIHGGGLPVVVCGRGLLRIDDLRDEQTGCSVLPLRHFRTRFVRP